MNYPSLVFLGVQCFAGISTVMKAEKHLGGGIIIVYDNPKTIPMISASLIALNPKQYGIPLIPLSNLDQDSWNIGNSGTHLPPGPEMLSCLELYRKSLHPT